MQHHSKSQLIRNILKHSDATGTERIIQIVLAEYSDMANTSLNVSEISEMARVSKRQAQRAIKKLLEEGYISRTPGNGRGHVSSYHTNVTTWKG
jgi:Fic family protein